MKTEEDIMAQAAALKEMMAVSPGWKAVLSIIREMQDRAFEEWSELDLDAKPEKVSELKFTKRILNRLLEEIKATITLGEEAADRIERQKEHDVSDALFLSEHSTGLEMEGLSKPQTFIEKIFGRSLTSRRNGS